MVVLQLDEKCGDTPRPMREKCATPAWVDETSLEKQASPSIDGRSREDAGTNWMV